MRKVSVFNRSPTSRPGPAGSWPSSSAWLMSSERTILGSIFNRIAIDVASASIGLAKLTPEGYIQEFPDDSLNHILRVKPNINQPPLDFKRDIAMTMCTAGVAIVVPVDTDDETGKPLTMQVGTAMQWYPDHVLVNLFNNDRQMYEDVFVKKEDVAIIPNPLYTVMNDEASAIKRLMRKLASMDSYSEAAMKGRVNVMIGLPYEYGTPYAEKQARARIESIDRQMNNNSYGIVYIGANDKVTTLNKPLDLDILGQVKELEAEVFSQMGVDKEVFLGTADEAQIRNYHARTRDPFLDMITEAMSATSWYDDKDNYRIIHTKKLFAGVTGADMADMTDKYRRNSILKPNEVRTELGMVKSDDPAADSLSNSNMPMQDQISGMGSPEQGASQKSAYTPNIFNNPSE